MLLHRYRIDRRFRLGLLYAYFGLAIKPRTRRGNRAPTTNLVRDVPHFSSQLLLELRRREPLKEFAHSAYRFGDWPEQ
jgi:hypothetical protein